MITCDLVYSLSELSSISEFPSQSAITWLQTSRNVDITGLSKGHISVLLEARVTWSGVLVVLYVLCMMMWPWPDPTSRSQSCGNDRQPPSGVFSSCTCSGIESFGINGRGCRLDAPPASQPWEWRNWKKHKALSPASGLSSSTVYWCR